MLLRASGTALGDDVDVRAATTGASESGVPHGDELGAYASAAHVGGQELEPATESVRDAVGVDGWVEAAMTVAIFNGLVRAADASGIPLDDGVVSATADDRASLGLNHFAGSVNSDLTIGPGATPGPSRFG